MISTLRSGATGRASMLFLFFVVAADALSSDDRCDGLLVESPPPLRHRRAVLNVV